MPANPVNHRRGLPLHPGLALQIAVTDLVAGTSA